MDSGLEVTSNHQVKQGAQSMLLQSWPLCFIILATTPLPQAVVEHRTEFSTIIRRWTRKATLIMP
jgi:hypothetical protein